MSLKIKKGTVVRVARADKDLPPVGTLGTALIVEDLRAGIQWGPDERSFVIYEQFLRGFVKVFQP